MLKKVLFAFMLVLIFSGCNRLPFRRETQGAIQVTSNHTVMVYLNDTQLGQSPYFDETIKVGEYIVKLEPLDSNLPAWQTKLVISPRALTVVDYQVSQTGSSNYVMQLLPISGTDIRLTLTTLPNNAVIKINNEVKGFSPLTLEDLPNGDYAIVVSAPGYEPKTLNAKTTPGYHLITQVELARDGLVAEAAPEKPASPSAELSEPETATPEAKMPTPTPAPLLFRQENGVIIGAESTEVIDSPYVRILEASPGINWLRVRSQPSGLANNEVAKVRVGTYFPYLDQSEDQEWVQIQFGTAESDTGWVASQYVQITND